MAYDLGYEEAHAIYADVRRIAFTRVLERSLAAELATSPTRLTDIDRAAIRAFRKSWAGRRHWTGGGGWPWDVLAKRYVKKPRAFHAAIWEGDELCGLAVGSVSKRKRRITLHYLESSPRPDHPLRRRVTRLALEAAADYGRALGCQHLFLRNPLPGALPLYLGFGFVIAGKYHGSLYLSTTLE